MRLSEFGLAMLPMRFVSGMACMPAWDDMARCLAHCGPAWIRVNADRRQPARPPRPGVARPARNAGSAFRERRAGSHLFFANIWSK